MDIRRRFTVVFVTLAVLMVVTIGIAHWARVRAQNSIFSASLSLFSSETTLYPGQTFTVAMGLNTPEKTVQGIDASVYFDSDLFEVESVTIGTSELKTLLPGVNNVLNKNLAININPVDSSKSKLDFGLAAFDSVAGELTPGILGNFPPQTNPLAVITFKSKTMGTPNVSFNFLGQGNTTDTNVVTNEETGPVDILLSVLSPLSFTVTTAVLPCEMIDFDANSFIDVKDVMSVASVWGSTNTEFDLDLDGTISVKDIQAVATRWGETCQ